MAKAPSEKHLEDWIVANPELFGEDYDEDQIYPYVETIVGRQVRLPSGIADLMGAAGDQFAVVELKAGAIDETCVGQVLRYMGDLKHLWMSSYLDAPDETKHLHQYWQYEGAGIMNGDFPEIQGFIVGHSVKNYSLVTPAHWNGIEIITYDLTDDGYIFERVTPDISQKRYEAMHEFSYGIIGETMREVMRYRTARNYERSMYRGASNE